MTDERFRILDSDKAGTTWPRIEKHLKERLSRLREMNDAPLDEIKTASLRGQIEATKKLLDAAKEIPPPLDVS